MKKSLFAPYKATLVGISHGIFILLMLLVLAFAALLWRIQYAPVDVSFLEPSINQSFEENNLGLKLKLKSATLVWSEIKYPLSIVLDDVSVLDKNGTQLAKIDESLISLSFEALLFGKIKASRLIVEHPSFYIIKDKEGKFLVDFSSSGEAPDENQPEDVHKIDKSKVDQLISIFSAQEDVDNFFGKLDVLKINNAKLVYIDHQNKTMVEAPNLNAEFERGIGGFSGNFETEVLSKNLETNLKGSFNHHTQMNKEENTSETFVSFAISEVNLKSLLKDIGFNDEKASYDGTITTSLKFSFLNNLSITYVNFDTEISNAKFSHTDLTKTPLLFDKVKLNGNYDVDTNLIKLTDLSLDSANVSLKAEAEWDISETSKNITAEVSFDKINVKSIKELWLEGLAPNPREWIMENLIAGDARKGLLKLKGGMEYGNKESFTIDSADGSFEFDAFQMSYLPDFPIIENGKGTAKATLEGLVFDVESGTVADLKFGKSLVTLYDFGKPYERINIKVNDIEGPALTVAKGINNYPLQYIDKIKQKPEHFSGTAKGNIILDFPLDRELEVEEVDFSGEVSLVNFGLEKAAIDKNLTEASLEMKVDTKELHAKGTGKFDGVDLPTLEWNEYFTDASKLGTQIRANFTTSMDKVKELGVDLAPYFTGNASSQFEYNSYVGDIEEINLDLDLKETVVDFSSLFTFTKAKDVAAEAKVKVNMKSGAVESVDVLSASSSAIKLDTKGQVFLDKDLNITKMEFPHIIAGDNDFSASLVEEDFQVIKVSGAQMDLASFFKSKAPEKTAEEKAKEKPMKLSLDLKKTLMPEGIVFKDVKLNLEEDKNKVLQDITFDALTPNGMFKARYGIHPEKRIKRLYVHSTSAGEALVGLGIAEKLEGGELFIKATADEKLELTNTVKGKLLLKGMTVIKAPTLARLVNSMSFEGMAQLFDGKSGLKFERIGSNIEWETGVDTSIVRLRDGKTRSASLGLTFEGLVDIEKDRIDMNGTIVPVSDINNFVANIPVLGDILTMGTGDAIFAATYSIKGPTEDSKVSVNPLSALAPGFLRKLFFEQDFNDSEVQE